MQNTKSMQNTKKNKKYKYKYIYEVRTYDEGKANLGKKKIKSV